MMRLANFRMAQSLEKLTQSDEAAEHYLGVPENPSERAAVRRSEESAGQIESKSGLGERPGKQ